MKIALLQTGKTSERYLTEGIAIFEERLRKYSAFEIFTVPDIRRIHNLPEREQKIREGEQILRFFRNDDYIVILDDKGKEFSTVEFCILAGEMFYVTEEKNSVCDRRSLGFFRRGSEKGRYTSIPVTVDIFTPDGTIVVS